MNLSFPYNNFIHTMSTWMPSMEIQMTNPPLATCITIHDSLNCFQYPRRRCRIFGVSFPPLLFFQRRCSEVFEWSRSKTTERERERERAMEQRDQLYMHWVQDGGVS